MLSNSPKHKPTAQPGQGKRAAPIANPIPKRAMKAAVIAAFLSGKLIGNMIAMSMAPNTKPQIMPSRILDICPPVLKLLQSFPSKPANRYPVHNPRRTRVGRSPLDTTNTLRPPQAYEKTHIGSPTNLAIQTWNRGNPVQPVGVLQLIAQPF